MSFISYLVHIVPCNFLFTSNCHRPETKNYNLYSKCIDSALSKISSDRAGELFPYPVFSFRTPVFVSVGKHMGLLYLVICFHINRQ